MFARVSRFDVPGDRIDADIKDSRERVSQIESMPGSLGVYYLVDRENGKTMAVTLWEDEQSMQSSEQRAQQMREEGVGTITGSKIVSVDRYEVALQPTESKAFAR
jgi:heme-degrading monooxygenase HmoA